MDTILLHTTGHEWRLAHGVLLNVAVLCCAWRFIRRFSDELRATVDTLLVWCVIQYLSVTLTGLAGVLSKWSMTGVAAAISGGLLLASVKLPARRGSPTVPVSPAGGSLSHMPLWICALFAIGYAIGLLSDLRWIPPMSDDALTYHLPVAVRWLQTGRLVLHELWFFNHAATFTPLAGSAMAAWWYAPIGNDFLARFVQLPALALLYVAVASLVRSLGAGSAVTAAIALAAVLSRPFIGQAGLVNNDLYIAAFFVAAVGAMSQSELANPLGPWRLGMAVGLMLATKYTTLLALPALLLMVDAPLRANWGWRQWTIAAGVPLLLAGPWFVRNWVLTGNPLYPQDVAVGGVRLFTGIFSFVHDARLGTWSGVWNVLAGQYLSMPPVVLGLVGAAWFGAIVMWRRRLLAEPLIRGSVFVPPVGILIYVLASPHAEVRYLYPSLALLFGCAAAFPGIAGLAAAVALCAACMFTGFSWTILAPKLLAGAVAALAGGGLMLLNHRVRRFTAGRGLILAGAMAAAMFMLSYVYQDSIVYNYSRTTNLAWEETYGDLAKAWTFVRTQLPRGARLAYCNTYLTYPLMGFEGDRFVEYAPTRAGLLHVHDMPRLDPPSIAEDPRWILSRMTVDQPDYSTWLGNLRRLRAEYLFVVRRGVVENPPELDFVTRETGRFEVIYRNDSAAVYAVRR